MPKKKGITKIEAVRRALAHLGNETKPVEIQAWIKKTFAIDMNTDHISTSKGDLRRKAAEAGKEPATAKATTAKPPAADISMGDVQAVKDLVGRVGAKQLKELVDLLTP